MVIIISFTTRGDAAPGSPVPIIWSWEDHQAPKGPFYDKDGVPLRRIQQRSGGTVVMKHDDVRGTDDRYYGPGHFGLYSEGGADYVTFHYYDPNGYYPNPAVNNRGGPTLGLARLVWGDDGWPSVSLDFVEEGVYTLQNFYSGKVADLYVHNPADGSPLYQYEADSAFFAEMDFQVTGPGGIRPAQLCRPGTGRGGRRNK